jgi:ribose 1,5-bisphosphokinase
MSRPGPVVAVVGPSGVGKDSVMAAVAAADPGFGVVRRVITREAGAGGEAFEAVGAAEFAARRAAGDFALDWEAHGLSYGIPAAIDAQRLGARGVLVNLSRSVLHRAQSRFGGVIVLALEADPQVLASRLAARGREGAEDRARRLARAGFPLPEGLARVHRIDNSGALEDTVRQALAALAPESV